MSPIAVALLIPGICFKKITPIFSRVMFSRFSFFMTKFEYGTDSWSLDGIVVLVSIALSITAFLSVSFWSLGTSVFGVEKRFLGLLNSFWIFLSK